MIWFFLSCFLFGFSRHLPFQLPYRQPKYLVKMRWKVDHRQCCFFATIFRPQIVLIRRKKMISTNSRMRFPAETILANCYNPLFNKISVFQWTCVKLWPISFRRATGTSSGNTVHSSRFFRDYTLDFSPFSLAGFIFIKHIFYNN